jgi:molecular chaperone DnaK (HSP70)
VAQVLAKAGMNLGGADVDNWLMNYFAETQGLAVSPITMRLVERLKIQLSLQFQAQEVYFDDRTLETIDLRLDRTEFGVILQEQQFFAKLDEVMQQVMQQAQRQGIQASAINAVLLVGGTTQIPAVQNWVQQYFDANQVRSDKPFEAIAQGALQISLNDVEVKDFLYHGYGVRYWDRRLNQHNWHPLIKSGQRYPMEKPVELVLGASVEQQPQIELIIGELGQETAQTEVYFDGDRLVTRNVGSGILTVQALNDSDAGRGIAALDPPGKLGEDRVKVKFTVDRNRFLCMSVEDLVTKRMLVEDKQVVQLS